jgi:hypothetical protein
MLLTSLTLLFLCLSVPSVSYADEIVIPNGLANTDGNFAFIGCGNCHFQQVYGASQFGSFGGPRLITAIAFRPDVQQGSNLMPTPGLLQISLSTTSRAVGGLSTAYADNVGVDNTLVLNSQYTWATANTGPPGGPRNFDIVIVFATPFLYDPSQGNLLIDFTGFVSPYLDMDLTPGGSVSGVIGSQGNLTGFAVPFGLVTQISHTAAPSAVPEPATIVLLGTGLIGLGMNARKRWKQK